MIKKYKQIKGYSVMHTDKELSPEPTLMDFLFKTEQQAVEFRGKLKADVVRVLIKQINK